MQCPARILVLLLLFLPGGAWAEGDVARGNCGVDGWGWGLGELLFRQDRPISEQTQVITFGTYIGVGRQMVAVQVLVGDKAIECGESCFHVVDAPRRPGIPAECVAQRVREKVDPVHPLD
jgi:hypothetical protein